MAYVIEVLSVGADLYPVLETAMVRLNGVQREFIFRAVSPGTERDEAKSWQRREYQTEEVWNFLKRSQAKFGGNRPYLIAFVSEPLGSPVLKNLFGSHKAEEGLAVATLDNSSQYVKEQARFASYYLARYALSFVNPTIKSHEDETRTDCYFHRKMRKHLIQDSMRSGQLCDPCRRALEQAVVGGHAPSVAELEALRKMREMVSGDYPHAIIMKGGGVKGLAYAGALLELENHYFFDRHVGTSAGALTAVLLAAGYTPAELQAVLQETDFGEFMDASWWKAPLNLVFSKGLFPGDRIRTWLNDLMGKKIIKAGEIKMEDLNGAVVYASRAGSGTETFDSRGPRKEAGAAFAARCSMAIPLFFTPESIDGQRAFDGGLRHNFPVKRFLDDHSGTPFVALYLGQRFDGKRRWLPAELSNIVLDGEERAVVDANPNSVVMIDTDPVGTVDFKLGKEGKDFLVKVGRAAALRFLLNRKFDQGPDEVTVQAAEAEAEAARNIVRARKRKKKFKRWVMTGVAAGIAGTIWLL